MRTARKVRELIEAASDDPSDRFDVDRGYIELRNCAISKTPSSLAATAERR
jgi:hypothetical protein